MARRALTRGATPRSLPLQLHATSGRRVIRWAGGQQLSGDQRVLRGSEGLLLRSVTPVIVSGYV